MTRHGWRDWQCAGALAALLALGGCAGMPGYGNISVGGFDPGGFGGFEPAFSAFSPDYAPSYAPGFAEPGVFGMGGLLGGFGAGEWHGGGWHGGGGGDWHRGPMGGDFGHGPAFAGGAMGHLAESHAGEFMRP